MVRKANAASNARVKGRRRRRGRTPPTANDSRSSRSGRRHGEAESVRGSTRWWRPPRRKSSRRRNARSKRSGKPRRSANPGDDRRPRQAAAERHLRTSRRHRRQGVAAGRAGAGQAAGGTIGAIVGSRAGPVGAVVGQMVGEKIGKLIDDPFHKLTDTLNTVTKATQVAGKAMVHVAGNDGIGALPPPPAPPRTGWKTSRWWGRSPTAGLRTFTTVLTTANQVVGAFAERGRELSKYDGRIAAATAQQDVTRLLADIKEAQRSSEGSPTLIDKVTVFEEFIKELIAPIKDVVVDTLPDVIEFMMNALTDIIKIGYLIPGVSDDSVKRIVDNLDAIRSRMAGGAGAAHPLAEWTRMAGPRSGFRRRDCWRWPGSRPARHPRTGTAPVVRGQSNGYRASACFGHRQLQRLRIQRDDGYRRVLDSARPTTRRAAPSRRASSPSRSSGSFRVRARRTLKSKTP